MGGITQRRQGLSALGSDSWYVCLLSATQAKSPSPRLRGPAISCQSSLHGCTMMGQDDSGRAPWAPPAPWGLVSSGPTALAGLLSPSQLQTESPKRRPTTRSTQWEARSRAEPQGMGSPQLLELCLPQAPGQS